MNIYKKIVSGIAVAGLSLFMATPALAAPNAITLSADLTVSLSSPAATLTVLSGSTMAGYTVNAGSFVVNLENTSSVTIQSPAGLNLISDFSPSTPPTCSSPTVSQLVLSSTTTQTVTVTTGSFLCVNTGGGAGGSVGGGGGGSVTPAPTATFTSNFSTVTSGQSATLSWTTSNASSVNIDQGIGSVAASGTRVVNPTQNTTYTLTATGAGGTVSKTVMVTVGPVPVVTLPPAGAHSVGSNVKTSDGTVWMVLPGNCRSAYTSAGAFVSYGFNSWTGLVDANAADLALPVCVKQYIPPQDGQIIIADRGDEMNTAFFISGGVKHGFVSHAVYAAQGFPESRLTGALAVRADVSWMTKGSNIESGTAAHFAGTLINKDGTILLVGPTSLLGIPDPATFSSWGYSFDNTVMANAADRLMPMSGVMITRLAGQLSPQ